MEEPQATAGGGAPTPIRPCIDRYAMASTPAHRHHPTWRERFIAEPLLALYWWARGANRLDATVDDLKVEHALWRFAGNTAMARRCRLELSARRHPSNEHPEPESLVAVVTIAVGSLCLFAVIYLAAHVLIATVTL